MREHTRQTYEMRQVSEKIIQALLKFSALITIFITFFIFLTLFLETLRFFYKVPIADFLFSTQWNPKTTYGGQEDMGYFGIIPLFTGTLLITSLALIVAIPLGLFIALFMSEYASWKTRTFLKPFIELLSGIPTIVYGFFAVIGVTPFLHKIGEILNLTISSESALGAGLVMGIMIIPFISSLADEALRNVPFSLRENSYALGATSSETIKRVVLPAAMPGILAGILLAIARAIGETMLVLMATGLTAHLTLNPLQPVTTITVQIVTLLTGDQEFNSPKTLSAFALGLFLFLATLILNIIALKVVHKYRKKYVL